MTTEKAANPAAIPTMAILVLVAPFSGGDEVLVEVADPGTESEDVVLVARAEAEETTAEAVATVDDTFVEDEDDEGSVPESAFWTLSS